MDRIVVAFPNDEAQRRIVRLLESGGFSPARLCATGAEAIRAASKLDGAAVICGFHLRGMTAADLAAALRGRAAVLVISTSANLDLCDGENLFKLATPARRADFFSTLELMQSFAAGNFRRPAPERREEDQRLIQRAKELLMDVNRMTEAEAHRFLQKRSMDAGAKLTDTARRIVDAYSRGAL